MQLAGWLAYQEGHRIKKVAIKSRCTRTHTYRHIHTHTHTHTRAHGRPFSVARKRNNCRQIGTTETTDWFLDSDGKVSPVVTLHVAAPVDGSPPVKAITAVISWWPRVICCHAVPRRWWSILDHLADIWKRRYSRPHLHHHHHHYHYGVWCFLSLPLSDTHTHTHAHTTAQMRRWLLWLTFTDRF